MVLVMGLFGVVSALWAQETTKIKETYVEKTTFIEKTKDGSIDWTKGMLYASGEGVMPSVSDEPNRAKAYLKAKGYARMQAIAHLLMLIKGTAISYEGLGKDYMAQDETLRQRIEGFVRGVEILDEKKTTVDGDTMVTVTVGTRMYGKGAPGSAFLEKLSEDAQAESAGTVKPAPVRVDTARLPKAPADAIVSPPNQVGPFTSVIVDCRAYNVQRAMSPKIRRADGSEVWGTVRVDPDFVNETGILSYARNIQMARGCSRCGSNPLIVRAVGRAGGAAMCDVVITDEDAARLLAENGKTKFLDQLKVIFLVDPAN